MIDARVARLAALTAVAVGAAACVARLEARAETSSWNSQLEAKGVNQHTGRPAAPQRASPDPQSHSSEFSKTTLPQGDDAAYEAFDQGRYLTALALARKAAERGEPQAHTLIGRIYAEGLGTSRNLELAAQWYARGAELGDAEAMFAYGLMLVDGRGVPKDRVAAAWMFEAAAAKRHALANYNLALLFLEGQGKPENPYRAALHMRFAAEAGIAAAQYDLGTLYASGTGVEPNAFEAAKWIGKAAAAGHPAAELEYAVLLFRGHGVAADPQKGAEFLRGAAERGVVVAQNRLARCYAQGLGVATDLVAAAKWHAIAKAGGLADAGLDKTLQKLSKADRLKAEQEAQSFRERVQAGIE
jgi:TPR repeat protein